jgi:hypothetical protein
MKHPFLVGKSLPICLFCTLLVSDEIADLEDKFPIPNFTQQLDDDFVKGLEVDLKKENALLPNEILVY